MWKWIKNLFKTKKQRHDEKLAQIISKMQESLQQGIPAQGTFKFGISFQCIPDKQIVDIEIMSPPTEGKTIDEIEQQAQQMAEVIHHINSGAFEHFVFLKLQKIAEEHPEHRQYIQMIGESIATLKKYNKSGGALRPRDVFRHADQPI